MNTISRYLRNRKLRIESEQDPQWPGSVPIQLVEHTRQDSLGHRVLNKVMAVMLVALILCIAWGVL